MKLKELLQELDLNTSSTALVNMETILSKYKDFASRNPDAAKNIDLDSDDLEKNVQMLKNAVELHRREEERKKRTSVGTRIRVNSNRPSINRNTVVRNAINRKIKINKPQ